MQGPSLFPQCDIINQNNERRHDVLVFNMTTKAFLCQKTPLKYYFGILHSLILYFFLTFQLLLSF